MPQLESRIRQKADSAANWEANNPVLLDGEIAVAITGSSETRLKVGDGAKRFSQQPYLDELLRQQITAAETRLTAKADLIDGKVRPEQMTSRYVLITGSRMLTAEDQGKLLVAASANPVTLTIPRDATALIPDGTEIQILQYGPGIVTVAGETAGVLIDSLNDRYATPGMFSALRVKKLMSNEWMLEGASSVPVTRTINGKPLDADITQAASDVNAVALSSGKADTTQTTYPFVTVNANRTIQASDLGKFLRATAAVTLTLPSTVLTDGFEFNVLRAGTGAVTVTAPSGVSINGVSAGSVTISDQYKAVGQKQFSATVWYAFGAL